jgi:RNA polymerase sigma factor (sigma-70 family)
MTASNSERSDKELLELMSRDNRLAFNLLYYRYWNIVFSFALRKTTDVMDAENIVQDIFFSLWQRRFKLQITGDFQNYLVVAVKYQVIKLLNRQRSQQIFENQASSSLDMVDDSTQEYLAFEELYERLEATICSLPKRSQLIYRLNKEDGFSYKEIGDKLNLTEKAVGLHLVRIKKTLRSKLSGFLTAIFL